MDIKWTTRCRQLMISAIACQSLWMSQAASASTISAGYNSSCTTDASNNLWCWGNNEYGQLGIGNFVPSPSPRQVTTLASVSVVSVGQEFACAISNGALYCWGLNSLGELGNGTTSSANVPTLVSGMSSGVTAVSAGGGHACAIQNNQLFCWGNNDEAQVIGNAGGYYTTPQLIAPLAWIGSQSIISPSAGSSHTCVIVDGAVWCWGYNFTQQAGQPMNYDHYVVNPSQVAYPYNDSSFIATSVRAGHAHTCGLYNGIVFCWGGNVEGELGLGNNGYSSDHYHPTVSALGNVASISTGASATHTCALTNDGVMYCWGYNGYGQLGDNTTTDKYTPVVPIYMGAAVAQISVGAHHTCSWYYWGTKAACWGYGQDGQLGNNTFTNRWYATEVSGF